MKPAIRLFLLLGVLAAAAVAQLTRGFVSGTITDSTGAVVANVKITLAEQATGVRHAGLSNEAGVYRFAALEPGTYTVTFEKAGFETVTLEGIELTTAREVVLPQTLPVAGTATAVSVEATAAGAELSKSTPTVERTLAQHTIESLPMTGPREVANVAILAPGTAILGSDATQTTYAANGQRGGSNSVTIDGIDNTDPQFLFLTFLNAPEGVAEVQVRTNTFSAEYGRGLGSQVSIISRSGSNRLRGEAWDFYSSNRISAATLANKYAGLSDVRSNEHQPGASLGGPVRRNRTFFFVLGHDRSYREGTSANGIAAVTIPTAAGFAALQGVPLGAGQTVESRQAILNSLAFLPGIYGSVHRYDQVRNVTVNGVPVEFGTARIGQSRPTDGLRLQGRLDHRLSERDTLFYRFQEFYYRAPITVAWPFTNNVFGRRFASSEDTRGQVHSLSHTRVFTPALVNELRLSAVRHRDAVTNREDAGDPVTVSGNFALGPNVSSPFIRPRNTYEAQDVLTWTRGRHSLKFGAHFLWMDDTVSGPQHSAWTFTNFTDFMNNQANTLVMRFGSAVQSILSVRQNYFAQDDFKLSPNLTLNIGVRYQTANAPDGLFGARTPEMAAAGVAAPLRPDRNDVGPRLGFAWSPRGDATVIRGGYGIGYGLIYEGQVSDLTQLAGNWNTTLTLDRTQLTNAFPGIPARPAPGFNPLATFANYQSGAQNPTTHFYSFSVQREFARQYILEAGYLGSRSYHLYVVSDNNPANLTAAQARQVIATGNSGVIPARQQRSLYPQWGPRTSFDSSGYSNYNAGYLKIDRRFSRGLLIGANYTWSATLGAGESAVRLQNTNDFASDYARSYIDVPHRLVIHYVWETPGRRIYGGWRISGISQWQSGRAFSLLTGVDSNGDGAVGSDRPDYNPAGRIALDPVTHDWRSFTTPVDGSGIAVTPLGPNRLPLQWSMPAGGNLGRNTFRGPAFSLWSLSLAKTFRIAERASVEFRADADNLFNHRNFGPPVTSMNTIAFGRNTSTPPSRVLLLGAKLRF